MYGLDSIHMYSSTFIWNANAAKSLLCVMKTDSERLPVRSRERLLGRTRERGIGIILVNVCWFVVDFVNAVLVSFS